jgi:FlaA1/EpsC-like NDP-sugar epimerase
VAADGGPEVSRVLRLLGRWRPVIQSAMDGIAWVLALAFASLVLYDFHLGEVSWAALAAVGPLAWLAQTVAGLAAGLYIGRWRFGGFEEVAALVKATIFTTVLVFVMNLWIQNPRLLPRSAPVAAGATALVLMAGIRYGWRLALERRRRPSEEGRQRLLVFGAGDGSAQVVRAMLSDPKCRYLPVALLDDDSAKRNLRLNGVPVIGRRAALATAAQTHRADALLIAIPSASAALVTELSELAATAGLPVKVLPPVSELFEGSVGVTDIRDVTPADLLGRHEITTDLDLIAGYLTGRRVLVTGAGGSIGSELCRQIYRFAPSELIMLDRDESALHAVQLSISGRADLESPDLVLVDIRDQPAIGAFFAERRPEVVFHAAALKHVTLLERHPLEAVKSNVWGTLDLLEAAAANGVERFVNISTDKAADPTSVLGYSKRIAERLAAHVALREGRAFLSVRFGNVLGSRGSVLTTFQAQIENGGPITVTDPDVTRFFMTVEEAVELVIQAGAIGRPGDVLVLDMGEPVNIAEVARLLSARSERHIAIEFTGLRPGEKLHEIRLGAGEVDERPFHPLISHVAAPPLAPESVRTVDVGHDEQSVTTALREWCSVSTTSGRGEERRSELA